MGSERNTYGQGETQQEILVEGSVAKKCLWLSGLANAGIQRSRRQMQFIWRQKNYPLKLQAVNESLEQVQSRLELVTWLDKYGISVRWCLMTRS